MSDIPKELEEWIRKEWPVTSIKNIVSLRDRCAARAMALHLLPLVEGLESIATGSCIADPNVDWPDIFTDLMDRAKEALKACNLGVDDE